MEEKILSSFWNFKKLRHIPKRIILSWILLTLIVMWLFVNVFFVSSYQVLDVIYEEKIIIEKIQINRQRDEVLIYANGNIYYMSYASRHVSKSIRKIKEDLSNGNLSIGDAVDIKFVSADDILFNFIWNKKRIVDLKTDQTSYYTLDTEKKVLKDAKMSMGC